MVGVGGEVNGVGVGIKPRVNTLKNLKLIKSTLAMPSGTARFLNTMNSRFLLTIFIILAPDATILWTTVAHYHRSLS